MGLENLGEPELTEGEAISIKRTVGFDECLDRRCTCSINELQHALHVDGILASADRCACGLARLNGAEGGTATAV